jgi:hypothetical protein
MKPFTLGPQKENLDANGANFAGKRVTATYKVHFVVDGARQGRL